MKGTWLEEVSRNKGDAPGQGKPACVLLPDLSGAVDDLHAITIVEPDVAVSAATASFRHDFTQQSHTLTQMLGQPRLLNTLCHDACETAAVWMSRGFMWAIPGTDQTVPLCSLGWP